MRFYSNVHQGKGVYYYSGYEDGIKFHRKIRYEPYMFVSSGPDSSSPFKTLDGQQVDKKHFGSVSEARKFLHEFNGVGGFNIYGSDRFVYNFLNDEFPGKLEYDFELLRIGMLDIEVGSDEDSGFPSPSEAAQEVTAITLGFRGKYYAFGCYVYNPSDADVEYIHCEDERDLLRKFIRLWRELDLDIISGWFIAGFDIPYLYNRLKKLFGDSTADSLSPWGKVELSQFTIYGETKTEFVIAGITTLDYMDLYKKHAYNPLENYKLETVAREELGVGKIAYKGSLVGLWKNDFKTFMDYNIRDVRLVVQLDEKMRFIELVCALAFDAKVNFQDTYTTVKIWDVIIHNYLLEHNIVVPLSGYGSAREIVGGYVKETVPGLYRWVVSFDFASLYPSLIQQLNISPDTFVDRVDGITPEIILKGLHHDVLEECKERNLTLCSIGTRFSREKPGFLSELMARKYAERAIYKDEMFKWENELQKIEHQIKEHGLTPEFLKLKKVAENNVSKFKNFQQVIKIQLNSAFGALANPGFRYFASDMAESITASGQTTTLFAERKLNEYLNKVCGTDGHDFVIAADTDSNYVCFDRIVNKFCKPEWDNKRKAQWLDKLCNDVLQPYLERCFTELCKLVNAHRDGIIVMKRENIGDVSIFVAKKRYVMNVLSKEKVFYDEPKLKLVGIEAVRSSTPTKVKEYIKDALKLVVKEDQTALHSYVEKAKEEFYNLPFEEVAFPRGVNNLIEYSNPRTIYREKTPIHVRAALLYNHHLKQKKLDKKYRDIREADKIKFTYLKMPNPIQENVIAVADEELPSELGLNEFIDYETQFSKSFLDPMQNILDCMGWSIEHRSTLEAFFG